MTDGVLNQKMEAAQIYVSLLMKQFALEFIFETPPD